MDRLPFIEPTENAELVRIEGHSMFPTLRDGDVVVVEKRDGYVIGDIVLACHPFKQNVRIVKRIAAILSDGRFDLRGDDPLESSDSRSFGPISREDILGKVVGRVNDNVSRRP